MRFTVDQIVNAELLLDRSQLPFEDEVRENLGLAFRIVLSTLLKDDLRIPSSAHNAAILLAQLVTIVEPTPPVVDDVRAFLRQAEQDGVARPLLKLAFDAKLNKDAVLLDRLNTLVEAGTQPRDVLSALETPQH